MLYICNMPTINKRAKQSPQRDNNNHQGRNYYHSGYQTKQWRAMRRDILQAQPLCVECGKQGRLTVANVIDHIKPVRLGGEFWDTKNMQPLCVSCHNSKSAKERTK
jgi:5-methylcytosine-specific restriction protein A